VTDPLRKRGGIGSANHDPAVIIDPDSDGQITRSTDMKYPNNTAVGATAVTLGLLTAITPAWATTTPVGAGFTLGLGAMTVIYGTWSLIARDPTRDHWALSVVGVVLGISPWVGGYAGDQAAWVAWIVGLALLALGGAAYIADEAANVTETVRVKELATYQLQHPHSSQDLRTGATRSGSLHERAC
jgi:SPW repeat